MAKRSVCFIGDDGMTGLRDAEGGWPLRLVRDERANAHALVPYLLGIEDDTTADVARRWRAEAEARVADLPLAALVFGFGANDQASDTSGVRVALSDSLYAAEAILADAATWRAVFWIGPAPVLPCHVDGRGRTLTYDPVRVRGLSEGFAEIAKRIGVPYLDLCEILDTAPYRRALTQGNGVVPDAEGRHIVAAAVGAWKPWREWLDHSLAPNFQLMSR